MPDDLLLHSLRLFLGCPLGTLGSSWLVVPLDNAHTVHAVRTVYTV